MPVDIDAEVIANTPLSADYNVLALAAPEIAGIAMPGQFVMVKARPGFEPLLRRPFSVFELLRCLRHHHRFLASQQAHRHINDAALRGPARPEGDGLGPLGKPFTLVTPPLEAWLVAGGVGLAPFAVLAERLRADGTSVTLFYGARSAAELFYLDFFANLGVKLVLTTEDGSRGEPGRITAPLDRELMRPPARHPGQGLRLRPGRHACGDRGSRDASRLPVRSLGRAADGVWHGRLLQLCRAIAR